MEQDNVRVLLSNCSILNGYDGMETISSFARKHPEVAFNLIWETLTHVEDPGNDEGPLCFELLELVASTVGRDEIETRLLAEWDRLPHGIRRNLINGFAKGNIVSMNIATQLFDRPSTTVRERHMMLATLASCRHDESPQTILSMAQRIGAYEDVDRQAQLEAFVDSVVASYN